eukprot:7264877-Prymnesium_polylepis.1
MRANTEAEAVHEERVGEEGASGSHLTWPVSLMAYGLWCAVRRYSDATRSCGAWHEVRDDERSNR